MGFISGLGIDTGVIVSIVAVSEWLKAQDKGRRLAGLYFLFPFFLSVGMSAVSIETFEWRAWLSQSFIYFGVSSFGYNLILKQLKRNLKGSG